MRAIAPFLISLPIIMRFFLLCLLFVLSVNNCFGQNILMDTLEVSTTRIPLTVKETGRNITVIPATDLKQLPFTSLDDLLQYLPGIEVQSRNLFGVQGDITMRGSTFTQVLILVDGMRLNDPLTGHFNNNIPITSSEIERIEILRGAAASMYGADAVGGVIHIITKTFTNTDVTQERQLSGEFNLGENALVRSQHGFYLQEDRLSVGGGFTWNHSDGQEIPEKTVDGTTLDAYRNYFDVKTAGLSMGYQMKKDWYLRARMAYDDRSFSARYFYTTSPFDKSTERTRNWWNQLQIEKVKGNSSSDINLAYKYNTDIFIFSPDFSSTNKHITQFFNLQINHLQQLNSQLALKVGGQLDRRMIESNDRGNHADWHGGVYVMSVYRPTTKLNLSASVRADYDQNYDLEFTPQLNLSYVLSKIVFRGSAGRSIRAADYTERYVSTNLENLTSGRSLGNPDLMAESAWSEEIGFDYSINEHWQLKTTAFFRQSDDLIDYVSTNFENIPNNANLLENASYFWASNIAKVKTKGLELEAWHEQEMGSGRLKWNIGYTYLNTQNKEEQVSVYIASHAGHLLTSNAYYMNPKFDVGISGLYKIRDERAAASINTMLEKQYTVWNIRFAYRPFSNFGLNLQVHNIFNAQYQDILGAKMPNRWLMGGITYSFL